METNELKHIWNTLDDRLKEQEMLNKNILKEVTTIRRYDKAFNRLTNNEWLGVIIPILVLPLPLLALLKTNFSTFQTILMIIFLLFLLYAVGSRIWKLVTLLKIDLDKPISHNISLMHKYNIRTKNERLSTYFIYPLLILFALEAIRINYEHIKMENFILFFVLILASIVIGFVQYKRVYVKNINSILKSLDELKELEEDE